MADYLLRHNANTHWKYPSSIETDAALEAAREAMAELVNGRPTEIAFGQNMTTLTYHLSRALGRAWGPGDEIVVTELDHHANVDPWKALAVERGVTIRTVRMRPETGDLDTADLERAVTPAHEARRDRRRLQRPRARSTTCAGRRQLAHSAGALSFVDAVHYAPHALVDVRAIGCDFPGLLALQVLRSAPRRPVGTAGADRGARRAPARARAGLVAGTARDRERSRTKGSSERRRRWTSWPRSEGPSRRPGGAPGSRRRTPRCTRGRRASSPVSGTASGGSAASPATVRPPTRRGLRPSRSPSRGARLTRSPRISRGARSFSRAGTSTPGPSCSASATPRTVSSARAARSTRRKRRVERLLEGVAEAARA